MTAQEFLAWTDEAAEKRNQCLAGKLSEEAYKEWLLADMKYKK